MRVIFLGRNLRVRAEEEGKRKTRESEKRAHFVDCFDADGSVAFFLYLASTFLSPTHARPSVAKLRWGEGRLEGRIFIANSN